MEPNKLYRERRAKGLCPTCGRPLGPEDGFKCVECKRYAAAWQRQYTRKRIAAGICVKCGKPSGEGYSQCEECRIKGRQRIKEYRARKRAEKKAGHDE